MKIRPESNTAHSGGAMAKCIHPTIWNRLSARSHGPYGRAIPFDDVPDPSPVVLFPQIVGRTETIAGHGSDPNLLRPFPNESADREADRENIASEYDRFAGQVHGEIDTGVHRSPMRTSDFTPFDL